MIIPLRCIKNYVTNKSECLFVTGCVYNMEIIDSICFVYYNKTDCTRFYDVDNYFELLLLGDGKMTT